MSRVITALAYGLAYTIGGALGLIAGLGSGALLALLAEFPFI